MDSSIRKAAKYRSRITVRRSWNGLRRNRTVNATETQPESWRKLQRNGLSQDWSWDQRAVEYGDLYARVTR